VKETPSEIISFGAWNRQRRQKLWHRSRQTRWTSPQRDRACPRSSERHEQSEHELSETLSPRIRPREQNGNQQILFTALDREVSRNSATPTSTN